MSEYVRPDDMQTAVTFGANPKYDVLMSELQALSVTGIGFTPTHVLHDPVDAATQALIRSSVASHVGKTQADLDADYLEDLKSAVTFRELLDAVIDPVKLAALKAKLS